MCPDQALSEVPPTRPAGWRNNSVGILQRLPAIYYLFPCKSSSFSSAARRSMLKCLKLISEEHTGAPPCSHLQFSICTSQEHEFSGSPNTHRHSRTRSTRLASFGCSSLSSLSRCARSRNRSTKKTLSYSQSTFRSSCTCVMTTILYFHLRPPRPLPSATSI